MNSKAINKIVLETGQVLKLDYISSRLYAHLDAF